MSYAVGHTYTHTFRFSQAEVAAFAQLTGDDNPLHLDPEYAATTIFKRPIIHGMLGASIFTKIIGTQFPGYGSIYMAQTFEFLRPMYVDTDYKVVFTIQSINSDRHTAEILGEVMDAQTSKVTTRGVATLMHRTHF
jgi:acyl dehydratase